MKKMLHNFLVQRQIDHGNRALLVARMITCYDATTPRWRHKSQSKKQPSRGAALTMSRLRPKPFLTFTLY